MSVQIYKPQNKLTLTVKDVLYYAKASGSNDLTLVDMAEKAAVQCLEVAAPCLVYRYFALDTVDATGVILDNGCRLDGKLILKYLSDCCGAYVVAATIGMSVDRYIKKSGLQSRTEGLFAAAAGSAAVESLLDDFILTLPKEKMCKPRISPGFGDFDLANQKTIFKILDVTKMLGVCLNDSLLMSPSKSVSAIIGCRKDIVC